MLLGYWYRSEQKGIFIFCKWTFVRWQYDWRQSWSSFDGCCRSRHTCSKCMWCYMCFICIIIQTVFNVSVQVLTNAKSYDEAVEMFSKQYIAAPIYYILAGSQPNQGAVITRDRNILSNFWQLNVSSSDPNSWYLMETNYVCVLMYV